MKTIIGVIAVFLIGLAVTNPTINDYSGWARNEAIRGSNSKLDQALLYFLSGPIVRLTTTRENYIFFSLYRTELNPQHSLEVVGLASQFFVPLNLGRATGDQYNPSSQHNAIMPQKSQANGSGNASIICFHESKNNAILERRDFLIELKPNEIRTYKTFETIISANIRPDFVSGINFVFFERRGNCQPLFNGTMNDVDSGRIEVRSMAGMPVVHLIGKRAGGSGDMYRHAIILPGLKIMTLLTPFDLSHSNMGGFFVGDFGHGGGSGIAIWDADWNGGTHYSPHPYQITTYRWDGTQFLPPTTETTKQQYEPSPDDMPEKMNLPFRDQTQQGEFTHLTP